MKTSAQIDLLPPWARNAKNKKMKIIVFSIVQIFILLFLIVFILLLNMKERRTWDYSRELSEKLSAFDSAPLEAAEELQYAYTANAYIDDMLSDALPIIFKEEWLDFILMSIPEESNLTRFEYNAREIFIACITNDIHIIETHRVNLSEFFTYVRQGSVTHNEGLYAYEIRVYVDEEE